jgi:hypothetical protein
MKVRIGMLLVLCSILAACAGSNGVRMGQRTDVFQVVREGVPPGADEVLVSISASIKTHKESLMLIEPAKHGSDDYLLFIDINGQSINLPVQTVEETTDTDPLLDPESGAGLRYNYKTTIRLQPGRYTVSAYLPTEDVQTSQEIQLSGSSKDITVKPLYRGSSGRKPAALRWIPNFKDGVTGLKLLVN